jgi:hypothetical protein
MRLNGWQRIGVTLSVIWAVGAFIVTRNSQLRGKNSLYEQLSQTCFLGDRASLDKCLSDASENAMHSTTYWPDVAFFAVAPPLAAWLIAYIGVLTVRWVGKGFGGR